MSKLKSYFSSRLDYRWHMKHMAPPRHIMVRRLFALRSATSYEFLECWRFPQSTQPSIQEQRQRPKMHGEANYMITPTSKKTRQGNTWKRMWGSHLESPHDADACSEGHQRPPVNTLAQVVLRMFLPSHVWPFSFQPKACISDLPEHTFSQSCYGKQSTGKGKHSLAVS